MSNPFSSTNRPTASAYRPRSACEAGANSEMKFPSTWVQSQGRPSSAIRAPVPWLRTTIRSACSKQARLLEVQTGGVRGGLAERPAAAKPKPGPRVGAAAPEARRAVAVGDCDRAEQAEVVQVENRAGAGRLRRRQRPPAEQRMEVVGVDDIGAEPPHRPGPLRPRRDRPARARSRLARGRSRCSSARSARPCARAAAAAPRHSPPLAPRPPRRGSGCAASGRASEFQGGDLCAVVAAILPTSPPGMAIALLTTYLTGYRAPLYERLATRHGVEVLCYGGGERYVPAWFADLDAQLRAAPFPARRLQGSPRGADPGPALRRRDRAVRGRRDPARGVRRRPAPPAPVRAVGVGLGAAALAGARARAAGDPPHLPPRRRRPGLRRARATVRRRHPRPRRRRVRRPPVGRARAVRAHCRP